jgi:hypothetical protein
LADYHSWINKKLGGDLSTIRKVAGGYFKEALKYSLKVVGGDPDKTEFIMGSELYEKLGIEWFGPTVEEFVKKYKDTYGYEPGYHAAGGYVAGLVLQKAIEDAGSLDTEAVKKALENMDIMTFFGRISFDTGEYYGRQKGHDMVYLQWQNKGGQLVKEVVWPESAKSSDLVYPLTLKYGKTKETTETPTEAPAEKTAEEKKGPGFEALIALAGVGVAYALRRKL